MNQKNLNKIVDEINHFIINKKFEQAENLRKKNNSFLNKEINFFLQGLINYGYNKLEESIRYYKMSIDEKKDYLLPHLKIAEIYDQLGNLEFTEQYLKEALIIKNNSDVIYNSLGYNLYKQKKFSESIEFFNQAININPNNYKSLFNIGNIYFKTKKYKEAINYYKKAIEINNLIPDATFYIAESFKNLENYSEAYKYYLFQFGTIYL